MRIIAAVDLSPPSLRAARSAAELALVLGDSVLLLQAVPPLAAQYPQATLAEAADLDEELRRATRQALEKQKEELAREHPGVSIEARLEIGLPEVVLGHAAAHGARMIVMGTRSRGPLGRLVVGSVCQRTMRQAPCPVLALPGQAAPFQDWARRLRALRVMVGVDRGPATEAALAFLTSLREAGPCDVTMVHEYWPPAEYARLGLRGPRELGRDDPEVVAVLDRDLRATLPPLRGAGTLALRVRGSWGPPGAQLALEADADRVDLLVLGTQQPHGLERLRWGSDALSALHSSSVPLLVVPARSQPERRATAPIPIVRSVLVATDLSELGNAAIPHAYSLVRRPLGKVELCHVHERHLPGPAYLYGEPGAPADAETVREAEKKLAALVPAGASDLAIDSRVTVIDSGSAAEQILAAAARLGVDAIVVSSHGRGGLTRTVMGSVAEAVVRGSDRPVYVVRARQAGG